MWSTCLRKIKFICTHLFKVSGYVFMYLKFNWKNILPDYDNKFDHPEVPTFQTCLCKKRKEKSRLEVSTHCKRRIEEKQPWRSLKYFSKPRVSPFIDASHCPIWLPIQVCFHNSNYDYWCMNQVAIWVRLWRQSKSTVNQNQEINSEIIAKSLFLKTIHLLHKQLYWGRGSLYHRDRCEKRED